MTCYCLLRPQRFSICPLMPNHYHSGFLSLLYPLPFPRHYSRLLCTETGSLSKIHIEPSGRSSSSFKTSIPIFPEKWPFFPKTSKPGKKTLKTTPKPYTLIPRIKNIFFWKKVVILFGKMWFWRSFKTHCARPLHCAWIGVIAELNSYLYTTSLWLVII